jgi:hypothetical protein
MSANSCRALSPKSLLSKLWVCSLMNEISSLSGITGQKAISPLRVILPVLC